MTTDPLEPVTSPAIRRIVRMACAQGYEIESAEWWSDRFVVWMNRPLTAGLKTQAAGAFPEVVFDEWPGGPHDPGSRGFSDGSFAVAFPWR